MRAKDSINEDVHSCLLGSDDSDYIRKQAEQILANYNVRLAKVGFKRFQIRLNIFFTFVQKKSVEAEAYDVLQSVSSSVMNDSRSSSVE